MTVHEKFIAASAEYIRRLRFNNLSPATLKNYDSVLARFGSFLAEQPENSDLYAAVEAWRDEMLGSGKSPASVRQYLIALNVFFDRATKRSFPEELRFDENPVDDDFLPKVSKKPYCDLIEDSDIMKLWRNEPPTPQCKNTWARNYALVVLILGTGLRNKEVLDLKLSDVDFLHGEIVVKNGKGDKYRIVDAPQIVLAALEQYLLSGTRPSCISDDDYLFGTFAAHEMGKISTRQSEEWHRGTTAWLSQLIERHVQNVCKNDALKITSHDLRHLYARLQLNASGNISELQAALGHSSPNTTQIYAGRVQPHRKRDSAREVLAERDKAARQLAAQNRKNKDTVSLLA